MSDNPLDSLARLTERVHETLKRHGLRLIEGSVVPGGAGAHGLGNPHTYRMIVVLDDEDEPKTSIDVEFDKVLEDAAKAEVEARAEKARRELQELRDSLSDPDKGIGL